MTHSFSSSIFPIQNSLRNFAVCFLQRVDHSKSNGSVASEKKKDDEKTTNGHVSNGNGVIHSNKAEDYYVKSEELTANLTQRRLNGQAQ
jgi:hypothetical protein